MDQSEGSYWRIKDSCREGCLSGGWSKNLLRCWRSPCFLLLQFLFSVLLFFCRGLLGVITICVLVLSIYFMFLILFPLLWCFILPLLSFSLNFRLSFPFLLFHIHSSNPFLFPPLFLLLFPSLLTSRLTYLSPPSLQPNETGCAVPDSPPPFRFPEREKKI